MATDLTTPAPVQQEARQRAVRSLENGAHLSAAEFLRRYEAMPEVKKAELINGIVRSRVFPGLWLDTKALLAHDGDQLLATLREGLASPEHKAFVAELRKRIGQ